MRNQDYSENIVLLSDKYFFMFLLNSFFYKVRFLVGIIFFWLILCGLSRSPKESKFALQDLQPTNMLQSMPPLSEIPLSFYFLAFAFVASIAGGIFLVRYLQKKKIREDLEQIATDQAQLSVDSEFEARQVDNEDRSFLIEFCGTRDPVELLPVIMSAEKFEKAVLDYKKSTKYSKSNSEKVFLLRKSLQFTFKNIDSAFTCSQMLESGTQLEFQIRHKQKKIIFTSTIIDSNEMELLIKPPTVKRRPANIKQFRELYCNIRRENDADYEFKVKIIGQLVTDLNAVVLKHTNNIRKLRIRVSERLSMELKMTFQLLSSEQFEMEKKFDLGRLQHLKVSGVIKDMSAGGLKVQLNDLPPQGINKSDVFLFHLPYASMRENIATTVIDIIPRGDIFNLHLVFRDVDMLTHIKLNQYLHRRKQSMEAA